VFTKVFTTVFTKAFTTVFTKVFTTVFTSVHNSVHKSVHKSAALNPTLGHFNPVSYSTLLLIRSSLTIPSKQHQLLPRRLFVKDPQLKLGVFHSRACNSSPIFINHRSADSSVNVMTWLDDRDLISGRERNFFLAAGPRGPHSLLPNG
jgi:hypothetical protein